MPLTARVASFFSGSGQDQSEVPAGTGPGYRHSVGRQACWRAARGQPPCCCTGTPGQCLGTGARRASPGYRHSAEVLSHCRRYTRVQALCQDTVAPLEYRHTGGMCMARDIGPGYNLPARVRCTEGAAARVQA